MPVDVREETRNKCDGLGINLVRAKLKAGDFGPETIHAFEWLEEKNSVVREQREVDEIERGERVASSAEGSAQSSQNAANAANKAAFWAKITALGALASAAAAWYPALNHPSLQEPAGAQSASMPAVSLAQASPPSSEQPMPENINEMLEKIKKPKGDEDDLLTYQTSRYWNRNYVQSPGTSSPGYSG